MCMGRKIFEKVHSAFLLVVIHHEAYTYLQAKTDYAPAMSVLNRRSVCCTCAA